MQVNPSPRRRGFVLAVVFVCLCVATLTSSCILLNVQVERATVRLLEVISSRSIALEQLETDFYAGQLTDSGSLSGGYSWSVTESASGNRTLTVLDSSGSRVLVSVLESSTGRVLSRSTSFNEYEIQTEDWFDSSTKNNLDLVKWAQQALSEGWGYVYGTNCQILTESILSYQISVGLVSSEGSEIDGMDPVTFIQETWLGKRTADCSGFVLGYLWFNASSGNIVEYSNGVYTRYTVAGFWSAQGDAYQKGSIDVDMPEIVGLAVLSQDESGAFTHMGIYIGDGQVIHASTTQYGVIQSSLSSLTSSKWMLIPGITYYNEDGTPLDLDALAESLAQARGVE